MGRISSRRIVALAEIGRLTVEITRADPGAPAVETIRRVCELLLDEVAAAATDVLPKDTAARFEEAFRRKLDEVAFDDVISGR